jgi:hypothetical protein
MIMQRQIGLNSKCHPFALMQNIRSIYAECPACERTRFYSVDAETGKRIMHESEMKDLGNADMKCAHCGRLIQAKDVKALYKDKDCNLVFED